MDNPTRAVAAWNADIIIVGGISVYPLSLALVGVLEELHSPLVSGENCPLGGWIQTMWAMTRPYKDVRKALSSSLIDELSNSWAESIPASLAVELIRACSAQVARSMAVVEDGMAEKKV